jgi:hypothetical protein
MGRGSGRLRAVAVGDNVITMFDDRRGLLDRRRGDREEGYSAAARDRRRPSPFRSTRQAATLFEGIAIYNALREHQQDDYGAGHGNGGVRRFDHRHGRRQRRDRRRFVPDDPQLPG